MLVIVEKANERVTDDFFVGHLVSNAFDDDFLVLVTRKITVDGEPRIDVAFFGQDGVQGKAVQGGLVGDRIGRGLGLEHLGNLSFANCGVLGGVGFLSLGGMARLLGGRGLDFPRQKQTP